MSPDTLKTETSMTYDTFTCFGKLPAELRLRIIHAAADTPRYIYMRTMRRPIAGPQRSECVTIYTPSKNYAAILQVNREFRIEILEKKKIFEYIRNPVTLRLPSSVYIKWDSDIIVSMDLAFIPLDIRYYEVFDAFIDTLQSYEKSQIERLMLPLPYKPDDLISQVRHKFGNLKELCFWHGWESSVGDFTSNLHGSSSSKVLVDVSNNPPGNPGSLHLESFRKMTEHLAEQKLKHPDWKLEKVRLVVWTSTRYVEDQVPKLVIYTYADSFIISSKSGSNFGPLHDDGTGILKQIRAGEEAEG